MLSFEKAVKCSCGQVLQSKVNTSISQLGAMKCLLCKEVVRYHVKSGNINYISSQK